MWPMKIDMSKDECRGVLRNLELEAYSSIISTFRAQGSLDSNKLSLLEQLQKVFNISKDRHKAEARRAANDEKLITVAELLQGKSFGMDWSREGHRSYPLIARTPPSTALATVAERARNGATHENSGLLHPSDTKRMRTLDEEMVTLKEIVSKDPNLPPTFVNMSVPKKDMKRPHLESSFSATKKRGSGQVYPLKQPLPPPNIKIQHLYHTLHAKRPRKSHASKKHSHKSRASKSAPMSPTKAGYMNPRMIHSYASQNPTDDKMFEGAELQKHLTSQLMPPPPAPSTSVYKSSQTGFSPILPTSKKDVASNLIKMNTQQHFVEPQPHPSNSKSRATQKLLKHQQQQMALANSNSRKKRVASHFDHIPDPKIIFSTTSSKAAHNGALQNKPSPINCLAAAAASAQLSEMEANRDHEILDSSLQLLSTAASVTPKIKISPQNVQNMQHVQNIQTMPPMQLKPSAKSGNIKILPQNNANNPVISVNSSTNPTSPIQTSNKMILKPLEGPKGQLLHQHLTQTGRIGNIGSKLSGAMLKNIVGTNKMQKIQLVVNNKNIGGVMSATTISNMSNISGINNLSNLSNISNQANQSPQTTMMQGKHTSKSVPSNVYTIGPSSFSKVSGGQTYTVIGDGGAPTDQKSRQKVIVQSIEQKFVPFSSSSTSNTTNDNIVVLKVNQDNQYNIVDNQLIASNNGREFGEMITEDTPIDIVPNTPVTSYPKVQLSSNFLKSGQSGLTGISNLSNKQIKLIPISGVINSMKNIKTVKTPQAPQTSQIIRHLKPNQMVPNKKNTVAINAASLSNHRFKINKNVLSTTFLPKSSVLHKQLANNPSSTSSSQNIICTQAIQNTVSTSASVVQEEVPISNPVSSGNSVIPVSQHPSNSSQSDSLTDSGADSVDWEQELDDVNRNLVRPGSKSSSKGCNRTSNKKLRLSTEDSDQLISEDEVVTMEKVEEEILLEANNNNTAEVASYDNPTEPTLSLDLILPIEKLPEEEKDIVLTNEPVLETLDVEEKEEYLIDSRNELPPKINGQMFLEETIQVIEVARKGGALAYEELVNSLQEEDDVPECEKIETSSNLTRTAHMSFDDFMADLQIVTTDEDYTLQTECDT